MNFQQSELTQQVAQTAKDFGINHNNLHSWIAQYSDSNQINQKNTRIIKLSVLKRIIPNINLNYPFMLRLFG